MYFLQDEYLHVCNIVAPLVEVSPRSLIKFVVPDIPLMLAKSHCQGFLGLANILRIAMYVSEVWMEILVFSVYF